MSQPSANLLQVPAERGRPLQSASAPESAAASRRSSIASNSTNESEFVPYIYSSRASSAASSTRRSHQSERVDSPSSARGNNQPQQGSELPHMPQQKQRKWKQAIQACGLVARNPDRVMVNRFGQRGEDGQPRWIQQEESKRRSAARAVLPKPVKTALKRRNPMLASVQRISGEEPRNAS